MHSQEIWREGIPSDLVKLAYEDDRNQSGMEGSSEQWVEKPQWSNQGPRCYIPTMCEGAGTRRRKDAEGMQKECRRN